MTETIEELGHAAVAEFSQKLAEHRTFESWKFHDEARRLETEVLMVFKATVLETKKMSSLDEIASAWEEMVGICREAVAALARMVREHPESNTALYHDRLVSLEARCLRFQTLHS